MGRVRRTRDRARGAENRTEEETDEEEEENKKRRSSRGTTIVAEIVGVFVPILELLHKHAQIKIKPKKQSSKPKQTNFF